MLFKRFVNVILDAQIIPDLKFFGMNTVKDKPTKNGFIESMKDRIKPVKQKYLQALQSSSFPHKFIVNAELYAKHFKNISSLQEWDDYETSQEINPDGRYPCRFRGCQSPFRYNGQSRQQHELTHDPHLK